MKQLIIIILFASIIFADTIIVDQSGNGDFYTISDAVDAASNNDTIFIHAGVYVEGGISTYSNQLYFIGVDKNSVIWTSGTDGALYVSSNSYVREITFSDTYVQNYSATLDVNRCIFDNSYISLPNASTCNVINSVFRQTDNGFLTNSQIVSRYVNIYNCVFYQVSHVFYEHIMFLEVWNSIFIDVSDTDPSDYSNSELYSYTCYYDSEIQDGYGNITVDPILVDVSNGDYRLQSDSPCIDTGNPAGNYNDPDGSSNDMGVYGGPNSWGGSGPVITNMQVSPEQVEQGETITIQATGTVE